LTIRATFPLRSPTNEMLIEDTSLTGVKVIVPNSFRDERGFFSETYNRQKLLAAGIDLNFVQDNHSLSLQRGVVRGMHFQSPPFAQDKLVRVVRGAVLDVTVDLRTSSPTYGQHFAIELSAVNWRQLLVPVGFAHGFCTLEPDTEVIYKVSNYYSAPHDMGVAWNDPALHVAWPISPEEAIVSKKDREQPLLRDLSPIFD
jgi:dTDP-4-dehydrorhamnose 3,5-epimerase